MKSSRAIGAWVIASLMVLYLAGLPVGFTPASEAPAQLESINARYGGALTFDPEKFHVFDIPTDRFEELTGIPYNYQAAGLPRAERAMKSMPVTGRVPTILIEWIEHEAFDFFHPPLAYDSLLYSDGIYPTGSANDYYQEVSYGEYSITGEVVGWITLASDYDRNYDINEIITMADPLINFADYDADGDGFVDALWIVHAGPGAEESGNMNDIWSHAFLGQNIATDDGVAVERWSMQPERHLDMSIISASVFIHEYAHILGIWDLYDYDGKLDTVTYFTPNDVNDHPVVDWDIMGYGGYNIMSYSFRQTPSHFCGYSRWFFGWATPQIPTCLDGTYDLYNIEEHSINNLLKVPITDDGTEYFLLEYRNPNTSTLFDHIDSDFSAYNSWFTPGPNPLDSGLLITHVDEKVPLNNGVPWHPNYAVKVVDAGYDPGTPWDGTEFTEWWYPYEFRPGALYSPHDPGQTTLSATTTPSSDGYTGPSGVTITVLTQNPDFMTVEVHKPMAPTFDPMTPVTLEATRLLDVPITCTDLNCTTPSVTPSGMPPWATYADLGNGQGMMTLAPAEGDTGVVIVTFDATDGALSAVPLEVSITVTPLLCDCPCFADPECDGSTTVLDVVRTVNIAFRNEPSTADPVCPNDQTDVNCDGATSVVDVVKVVNVAFRNEDPISQFCSPCGP